jgi:anti-sigma B factor antagonist
LSNSSVAGFRVQPRSATVRDTCVIALTSTTIRTADRDGTAVVAVTGEIDMTNRGPVLAVLTAQLDRRPEALVVDLTETVFFGTTGIRVLLETARRAQDLGVEMAVATDQRAVLRPLRITDVDESLNIRPTVGQALEAVQPAKASSSM